MEGYKLIREATGLEIKQGATITSFRGELFELLGFRPMPAPSTGRVQVRQLNVTEIPSDDEFRGQAAPTYTTELYPGVFGARIVPV